jgi:DNA topoisomerase VI subunit A
MAPPNEKNSIEQIRQTALIEADGNADKATRLLLDRLKEIPDLKKSLNQ